MQPSRLSRRFASLISRHALSLSRSQTQFQAASYSLSKEISKQIDRKPVEEEETTIERLTNVFSPETQPAEGRQVLDAFQALHSTAGEGVRTITDSSPDPVLNSMKNNDNPQHPTGLHETLRAVNASDYANNALVRHYYRDQPASMDADFAPSTIPSGYKDPESGVVYYNTNDRYLNTIPMKGLEDKFVDPDLLPAIEVIGKVVRCEGTNAVTPDLKVLEDSAIDKRLGHPNVYIKLDRMYEEKRCPYCGVHYKRVPGHKHEAKPFDVEKMPDEKDDWYVEEIKRLKGTRTPH